MSEEFKLSRRRFLKISLTTSGALLIGIPSLSNCSVSQTLPNTSETVNHFIANAWLTVHPDNHFTFIIDRSEMGQGVVTALSMLMAEELEVSLDRLQTKFAPVNKIYNDPQFRTQATGGSTSVANSWERYRQAGASIRTLFENAAAKKWGISIDQCKAQNGHIINPATQQKLAYSDLIDIASTMEPLDLDDAPLKDPSQFKLIGKPQKRLDSTIKTNGSAIFGIDVKVPGMLIATIKQAPVFGGKVKSFNRKQILSMPGVKHVVEFESAIAVVADHFWHAKSAADALQMQWQQNTNKTPDDNSIFKHWAELEKTEDGKEARDDGYIDKQFSAGGNTIEAIYELPYQAHATKEPMNCTAHVQENLCDVWVPTQSPTMSREAAARITGLDHENIFIHTTYLGCGFGRRSNVDFVEQAVSISKQVKAPVKLIWTREEDMQHDFYRPANYNVLRAKLDDSGMPIAWQHRIVGPPVLLSLIPKFAAAAMPTWLGFGVKDFIGSIAGKAMSLRADPTAIEGAANMPYAIENIKVEYIKDDPGIPVGFWRSVGSSQNAFIVESFIDELAHAAGQDPYQYRRKLLTNNPRHLKTLDEVAIKGNWDKPLVPGHFKGIAIHESFNSVAAQIAEISLHKNNIVVHRVDCAIDCGIAVNPNIIKQQMEGAIVFGLTAALKSKITIQGGRVAQSNFHDFPLLRFNEAPEVVVHIVPNQEPPTGIGEPGVPPIAPAVANAVFAATGKRFRSLPINLGDLV